MRIALVYNPDAGNGDPSADELRRLFEAEGHRVEDFGKKSPEMRRAIASGPDAIAIAGGDGTLARAVVASFKAGSQIPLLVVPVGTSNNIARSLGSSLSVPAIVRALASWSLSSLDVGLVESQHGTEHFVEAAGVGFLGAMLRHPMSWNKRLISAVRGALTGADLDERRAQGTARLVRRHPAQQFTVIADGEDLSGEYISVEVMNIREVGPRLTLAPDADCSDAHLDLVLFREADREPLALNIENRSTGKGGPVGVVRRVRNVELSWPAGLGHLDDEPWPDQPDELRVRVAAAGSVTVLRTPE